MPSRAVALLYARGAASDGRVQCDVGIGVRHNASAAHEQKQINAQSSPPPRRTPMASPMAVFKMLRGMSHSAAAEHE
jgi:hypothetical protein